MTAAKRATATITDAELEAVGHLTYRDAAAALGVGSSATARALYRTRGVARVERQPGEIAAYRTRASYRRNRRKEASMGGNVLGLMQNGDRVKAFWDRLDETMAKRYGMTHACPDVGTMECMDCEHGEGRCECPAPVFVTGKDGVEDKKSRDYCCHVCPHEEECPCSFHSWQLRQLVRPEP